MAAQPDVFNRMPDAATPLSLESIDPAVLPALRRFLERRGSCSLNIRDQSINFGWADVQLHDRALSLVLTCGTHSLLIELEDLGAIEPLWIGEPFELLPLQLRSLVVQRTFASLLRNLPRSLVDSVQLKDVRWQTTDNDADWPIKLGFRLQRGEDGCVTQGRLRTRSAATLTWLDEQLPAPSKQPVANISSLPIPIRIVIGKTDLTTSALRKLETGDVVWIRSARMTRAGVNVECKVGGATAALAIVHHSQVQLKTIHGFAMKAQTSAADAQVTPKPTVIDSDRVSSRNLEVPVTFDAGELTMPLSQLERLQPGAVLELSQDVNDSTIQLRIGNSLIARGALVAIGKRLGVRVTHVYLDANEASTNP